jgi:hypothetical protein
VSAIDRVARDERALADRHRLARRDEIDRRGGHITSLDLQRAHHDRS